MPAQTPVYLVDLFTAVVVNTATEMGISIHSEYGPIDEIRASLKEMSEYPDAANPKYPLIAMYDWDEDRGKNRDLFSDTKVNIIIATLTDQTWKSGKRYTESYKAVLVPIYMEFLRQIELSGYFKCDQDQTTIPHGYKDELDYGRTQEFIKSVGAVDFIDAISIKNMVLKVNPINPNR